ncbi:MAG TPA: CRTAC1 family protein [Thermoanaerobaculia bacterium]|nr:CRTAC1 family protein [Thermoanaerobaculia bacterium]
MNGPLALALLLLAAPAAPAPEPVFVDRAAAWGLDFRYTNGRTGELYFPEIMGGGAALFDYDGDGDLDAFLVQGHPLGKLEVGKGGRLFRNDLIAGGKRQPEPRFVDVTEAAGIRATGYGMGAAVGDFDNDGRPDLYLTNFGGNQLWKNQGDGTFKDVTRAASADDPRWSVSATFADFDRDGWLDLYVVNYVVFAVERNVRCFAASSRPDYCGPSSFPPVPARLLRNRGDGTFEDVSLRSGIGRKAGPGLGVVAADLDGDGWQDFYVANDGTANFLWLNQKDGTFKEGALLAGVAVNAAGLPEASMGVTAGDLDGDGDDDLFLTHLTGETNTLYVNQGGGLFEDRSAASGLAAPSLPFTAFGTRFLDYDNDGWLDLVTANGAVRILEDKARQGDPFPFAQRGQLFRNLGNGRFTEVGEEAGEPLRKEMVGRGAAFGDVDNDGDVDVLMVDGNGPARLLVNRIGSRKPWIGLRLMGAKRDLLGARVTVFRKGAPALVRRASTDGSYASANDPRLTIGLGEAPQVERLSIAWPDGSTETFSPPPLNTYTTLLQGTGTPAAKKP